MNLGNEIAAALKTNHEMARAHAVSEVIWQTYADLSQKARNAVPDDDFAGPNHSFPIRDQADVEHAAMLLHHADDPSAVKRRIIEIAHKKGLKLPATWTHKTKS